jgi:hypothetical protein
LVYKGFLLWKIYGIFFSCWVLCYTSFCAIIFSEIWQKISKEHTIKGKIMVRRAQLPLLCIVDFIRLHVSNLRAGHHQAFTLRNNLSFPNPQTANVSFRSMLVICCMDHQFVFPNISYFHLSENFAFALSSQYLPQLEPLKLCTALARRKCRRSLEILWTILTQFYALLKAARTLPQIPLFKYVVTSFLITLFLMFQKD